MTATDFADDGAMNIDPAKLANIISLSRDLLKKKRRIEEIEMDLEKAQEEYDTLANVTLPDAMAECSLTEMDFGNGWKIEMEDFFRANLPAPSTIEKAQGEEAEKLLQRLEAGLVWLESKQGRDIVADTITIKLKKGQSQQAQQIQDLIAALKLKGERGSKVHPQTLTKFLREKMEAGEDVPFDIFGVHAGKVAKLVPPKGK